eukprot:g48743.t1
MVDLATYSGAKEGPLSTVERKLIMNGFEKGGMNCALSILYFYKRKLLDASLSLALSLDFSFVRKMVSSLNFLKTGGNVDFLPMHLQ